MKRTNLIASMEAAMENETQQDTRVITDNITAGIPVETTVHNGDTAGVNEVVVETNPDDSLITADDFCDDEDVGVVCQVAQDIDDLEMVKTALESYETILQSMLDRDGEISAPVMMAVNKGLECFGLEPITNRFVSLEDVTGSSLVVRQAASDDYVGRVKENISNTTKRIVEAFRKFIEWIQNFYRTWFQSMSSKEKVVKDLLAKVKTVKEFKPVKINSPRALCVGSEFILNNEAEFDRTLNIFNGVFQFITKDGPQAARQYNHTVTGIITRNKNSTVGEEAWKELSATNHTLYSSIENSRLYKQLDKGRDELDLAGEYVVSGPAAGNYRFYMETRGYNDVPYIVIGFKEESGTDVPQEVEFIPDRQRVIHLLTNLLKGYDALHNKFIHVNGGERNTVASMVPLGDRFVTLYTKTLKGLFGDISDVLGQYARFANATCKVIERSIVE